MDKRSNFLIFIIFLSLKKVSECGQEIPQSHIADQPRHCKEESRNNNIIRHHEDK